MTHLKSKSMITMGCIRWLGCALTCGWLASLGLGHHAGAQRVDAVAQERVTRLIQDALWPSSPPAHENTNAAVRALDRAMSLVATFREASTLQPDRLDLRFGIASTLVSQALLTNAPFQLNMQEALGVYREIMDLDGNGFEAPLLFAAYSRATRSEGEASHAALQRLRVTHPERTRAYLERFERIEEILCEAPNAEPIARMPSNPCHAIVVLGAGLEAGGVMKPKLEDRLERGWQLAQLYPQAPVVVTGGNARDGVTEAYVMSAWFLGRGLQPERLRLEDQARDTVGNALLSCRILQTLGVTHATLVSSASHLQRALADFEEAALQAKLAIEFATLAAPDHVEVDELRSRVTTFRDVLRTSGLWSFPGMQR